MRARGDSFRTLLGLALVIVLTTPVHAEVGCAAPCLPATVRLIKPGIVGIGTHKPLGAPPNRLAGTGFAIGDGSKIVTNAHLVPSAEELAKSGEAMAVFVGVGSKAEVRPATTLAIDAEHDLALLGISGTPLPALQLGRWAAVEEGMAVAFTGFPIGVVLGLYPVTHTGIVSAITPIAVPARQAQELTAEQIRALKRPYEVLQLDATAYPGNSGSPVYRTDNGQVLGIINSVFVKGTKENVLKDPSGITFAIPVDYIRALLDSVR